jgi:mannose-6-phosphate isomerase
MPVLKSPLRFEPFVRPMVWGGRRLERLGKLLSTSDPYGESWEVSDHALAQTTVAEGPWAGWSLRRLMIGHKTDLLGPAATRHQSFPWLFKFLDADDWLSVQVHPDENAAKILWPGEGPKNEAWFVLSAEPHSRIYAGLLPEIGPQELRAAVNQGTVTSCLHSFAPKPGDFLYLPAGTVHAVGGGILLAEIQQTSDATFRLFDWNRHDAQGQSRPLHLEQSLACIDWTRGPITPIHVPEYARADAPARRPLAQTPYFQVEFVQDQAAFTLGGQGQLQAFCVLSGRATLESGETFLPGQVWILPAAMPGRSCRPETFVGGISCSLGNS